MDNIFFVERIRKIQADVNNRLDGLIKIKFADGIILKDIDERINDCIHAIDRLQKCIDMTLQQNHKK